MWLSERKGEGLAGWGCWTERRRLLRNIIETDNIVWIIHVIDSKQVNHKKIC